jgi:glycosyltransferase involved in cell wall biosynthesis
MPRVSILIPCRNAATTLRETLESALAQEGVENEIIVVDDGSSDGSLEIAKSYEAQGVRVIEGPRINASAARNRALEASSGGYIQYLDADDLLGANKISQQIEVLEKHPDCVATARWGRFTHAPEDAVFTNDDQLHDWTPVDWLIAQCGELRMMHPAAWLVPRGVADKAGPWDEQITLNDDGEYFARILSHAAALRCVPAATTYYRTSSGMSLSRSRGATAFESLWRSLRLTVEKLLALEDSPRTRKAAADLFMRFTYEVYPSGNRERQEAEALIAQLGGSDLRPDFGPRSRAIAGLVGWRLALALSRFSRKRAFV